MLTRKGSRRLPILFAALAVLALAMTSVFSPVAAQQDDAPDKPTGLEATATHGQVVLTWDDPQDDSISGYVILRRVRENDTGGDFSELVADTGTAALTYTDDTVAAGLTYTYRIKAINEHGLSERSRWFHVDTPAAPEPEQQQAAEPPVAPEVEEPPPAETDGEAAQEPTRGVSRQDPSSTDPVWSTVMTVGTSEFGGRGYDEDQDDGGSLDDGDFEYSSTTYTVELVELDDSYAVSFWVDMDGLPEEDTLTLEIDGRAFPFADRNDGSTASWEWEVPEGLSNSDLPIGDRVVVCLRTATQVCPMSVPSALSVADVSAEEGENLIFTVELSPASTETVTVDWATSGGTATSGTDFTAGTGTLTFTAGDTEQTVTVATTEDTAEEDHETITVTLSNATAGTISGATATGVIWNDDGTSATEPVWSTVMTVARTMFRGHGYADPAYFGDAGTFGSLSDNDFEHVSVTYEVFHVEVHPGDGVSFAVNPAGLPEDYALTLEIDGHAFPFEERRDASSASSWEWDVPEDLTDIVTALPIGDRVVVCLRGGAQVCPTSVPSALSVADVSAEEGEDLTFTVELSPASTETVTVDWATSGGTATSGTDFTAGTGTLAFAPDVTEQTVTVATIEDMTDEDHETITVTLSNASVLISGATATGTIKNDDGPPLVWSTTLTVGILEGAVDNYGYASPDEPSDESIGSLTDTDFEYRSITYEVDLVVVSTRGEALFAVDIAGLPEEDTLTLEINGHEFPFEDRESGSSSRGWIWDAPEELDEPATEFPVGSTATVCLRTTGQMCPSGNSNNEPEFSATTATFSLAENSAAATVVGTVAATDSDSDALTYTLSGTDASSFTIGSSTGQIQTKSGVTYNFESAKKAYSVTVSVRDNKDSSGAADTANDDTIAVTINLTNVNEAGTVTITGALSAGGTLTASVSDIDGTVSSLSWRWARGDSATGPFTNISGASNAGYTTAAADVGKYLRATASYTDPHGSGKSAEAVTGSAIGASNTKPAFDELSPATRNLAENSAPGTNVGNAVAATDSESDALTYTLRGADASSFTIDSSSGQIRTKSGVTYNFESAKKTHSVTVSVRDGKDAAGNASTATDDTIAVTINLTNVNEAPAVASGPAARTVSENSTEVGAYRASDPDASSTATWSVETAVDGRLFEISSSGVLSFRSAPNFEMPSDSDRNNTYLLTVKVTDNGSPALSATRVVAVTVRNVNEAPAIASGPSTTSVAENSTEVGAYRASDPDASSTFRWSVETGGDGQLFEISSSGVLSFRSAPDYERPSDSGTNNLYEVTVKVTDNGSPAMSATRNVVITVTDVNETPVISGNASPRFAEIEFDVDAKDLTAADYELGAYTAVDDDNTDDVDLNTITWAISGDDSGSFAIGRTSGMLSFGIEPDFENPVDTGSDNVYEIVVQAKDGRGGSGTYNVSVTVTNVNETPEFTAGSSTAFAEIEWHANSADLTVQTFVARDEETETISWSVAGADGGDFTIDRSSGVLSFRSAPDYETPAGTPATPGDDPDNSYELIVQARDTASNTRELPVTVTVTDRNERPEIDEGYAAPPFLEVEYDFTGTAPAVHTFTATDHDDGDTFTWSLAGADAGDLEIDRSSGVLTFKQDSGPNVGPLPNFEQPRDDDTGGSNTYNVVVRATDNDGAASDYAVAVNVRDVNEQPEFTGTPETVLSVDEHDADATSAFATYTARDEEGALTWSLRGADSGDFSIDSGGTLTFAQTPDYEAADDADRDNEYLFTVVATDVDSTTTRREVSTEVRVTVEDIEEAGSISVNNLSPAVGDRLTFALSDPDGGIVLDLPPAGFVWTIQASDPGTNLWEELFSQVNERLDFDVRLGEEHTGKQIRAWIEAYTDRRGADKTATSEATAAVTADPIANAPPRFLDNLSTLEVPETDAGTNVGEPLSVSDRDNDPITLGVRGRDAALFTVDSATRQLSTAQELDFETTSRVLILELTLHDGRDDDGNAETNPEIDASRTVLVTVTDLEEEGLVTLSVDEPGVGVLIRADLEDGDGRLSGQNWQWARSRNGRDGWSNIAAATSASYRTVQGDADFFLRAQVTYGDNRGDGKLAEQVTALKVFGENQRPLFPSAAEIGRSVAENARSDADIGAPVAAQDPENDRLTYALSGTEAAVFAIVETTGQIRVKDALDFETKPSYRVTVDVHDSKDGAGQPSDEIDASQLVMITIENVDEPGTVTLSSPTQTFQARVEVTAELTDDDRPSGVSWQWSRSPNGRTDWVNVPGATGSSYTPTLGADAGNYIRATASYGDGHGLNKSAEAVSSRVGDPPPVNSKPAFPTTDNGQRSVPEDAQARGAVGVPVAATDVNASDSTVNDPLVYSLLAGTDAASFTIDSSTGQLRVAPGVELDFEGKRSYRVTVEVTDGRDQHGDDDMAAIDDRQNVTINVTDVNEPPVVTGAATPSIAENSSSMLAKYEHGDPDQNETITWSVDNIRFWISDKGELYFLSPPSFEVGTSYTVTVTATDDDPSNALSGSRSVTVTVTDAEEEGTVTIEPPRGWDGTTFGAALDDDDGVENGSEMWQWERSSSRSCQTNITSATSDFYTADANDVGQYLWATVSYADAGGADKTACAALTGRIEDSGDRPITNNDPAFAEIAPERSVGQGTGAGRSVGAPVRATDEDTGEVLTYSLGGTHAALFDIDPVTGQIRTKAVLDYDPDGTSSYLVQVHVHDGYGPDYRSTDVGVDATIEVTITVTRVSTRTPTISGPTGGGGPSGPSPSTVDFEWTVKHDIEALAAANAAATGVWSDGETLWVSNNPDGAGDGVYSYDIETGERVEEREFELDDANRAPRGVWSDGTVIWVSDSGRDKLFAHDLASGERLPDSDLALHPDNDDPRGIWSDGETMWVLDGRDDALFAYDLASGELLAECALDSANGDPRSLWSDGVTIWVSDDGAKRLFAYRLPLLREDVEDADADGKELERISDEEFTLLSRASNNSPRGIWSDGDVMYVADASDDRVYSYNMPDAIDARLASLSLSGVDIGEFSPRTTEYTGVAGEGVTETTVEAEAMQRRTTVVIDPPDADGAGENGHQVALEGPAEITVTVTSADGSRERVYQVVLGGPDTERAPWPHCLSGDIAVGFSLVLYEGGGVEDLVACAQSRHVTALYALQGGVHVSHILGAPEFVNRSFGELFPDGIPPFTPLVAKSDGPPSADLAGDIPLGDGAPQFGPNCLLGHIAVGFSLVLHEGGSVEDLVACAQSRHVTALYALHEGAYVSYILGAPEFVNRPFVELFADGLPPVTPLVARSEGPPAGGPGGDGSESN